MLKSAFIVATHITRGRIAEIIGNKGVANDQYFQAGQELQLFAYKQAKLGRKVSRPIYLDFYPSLQRFWDKGYGEGQDVWEIEHCKVCQNPQIDRCLHHYFM